MMDFKNYEQYSSIGFIHNFEEAVQIVNTTVAGQIVSILPLVPQSSLQQTSVLIYHLVDASPVKPSDERSEKKLKTLFIGDAAKIVASLPVDVGDEVSFRNAYFVCDSVFEKTGSFYEMILCIGSPPSFNQLKNMFYRKKDMNIWISLVGLQFRYIGTNICINDYVPYPGKKNLYVRKSVYENDFMDSPCSGDIPSFTEDNEFELLQSSLQIPEKSSTDAAGEFFNVEFNVTENGFENSDVPKEANNEMISVAATENSLHPDETSHLLLGASHSQKIAVNTKTPEKSLPVAENQNIMPQKILNYYLYLMSRTITKYPSKLSELQERAGRDVINSPQNPFVWLPRKIPKAPFFIRVLVRATSPYITSTSSDNSILSLISFHCDHCLMYFTFPNVEWQQSDDEISPICFNCNRQGIRSDLDFSFLCEFLLQSEFGSFLPAVVVGEDADKFFGCTVSDLYRSSDTLLKIRQVFDFIQKRQEFLVLKVVQVCYGNNEEYRYHIMC